MKNESGVGKPVNVQKIIVSVDKSNEVVLQLNMDAELELDWDYQSFRKLDDGVVGKLTMGNLKRYVIAEEKAKELGKKVEGEFRVLTNPFNPTVGRIEASEFIRPRKGWHLCWKNPGNEFDMAMLGPYKQVREKGVDAKGKELKEEPGYETGEVKKRKDGDGKVEAIAVECPEEMHQQYIEWMAEDSRRKLTGAKAGFFQATEEINRATSTRGARITPFDESGELQV